jgi:hypothetical protein
MKKQIALLLVIIAAGSLHAKPCTCELTQWLPELMAYYQNATNPEPEHAYLNPMPADATYVAPLFLQQELQLRPLTKEEVDYIANKLCYLTDSASVIGFNKEVFERYILETYKISKDDKNKNKIVSYFLNTYKNELICKKAKDSIVRRDLHVYKLALFRSVINFFDELLLDEDNYTIDFNAYEMVDGKKETLVDYIDKLIEAGRHSKGELLSIRDVVVHLGGKRGVDL